MVDDGGHMADVGTPNLSPAERCDSLRRHLKSWESDFVQRHGRQARRDEIKLDTKIASKYKEYHRLRESLSGKRPSSRQATELINTSPRKKATVTADKDLARTRKTVGSETVVEERYETPDKLSTPTKNETVQEDAVKENLTPSSFRTVGPTPQKDGRVLGIFDLLSPKTTSRANTTPRSSLAEFIIHEKSPSIRRRTISTSLFSDKEGERNSRQTSSNKLVDSCTHQTPIKDRSSIRSTSQPGVVTPLTGHKNEKSPQSSTKRFLLDAFVTPSKRRRLDSNSAQNTLEGSQRQVNLDLGSLTPAFLRRTSQQTLHTIPENETSVQELEAEATTEDKELGLVTRSPSAMRRAQQPPRTFARTASLPVPISNRNALSSLSGRTVGSLRRTFTSNKSLSMMIKEIRKQRDNDMDEKEAILREIELGEVATSTLGESRKCESHTQCVPPPSEINSLLGADRDPNSDDDIADINPTNGDGAHAPTTSTSTRLWKKKGAKRQTRKVNMKPVHPKPSSLQRKPKDDVSRIEQLRSSLNVNTNKPSENATTDDVNETGQDRQNTDDESDQDLKNRLEGGATSTKKKISVTATAHMNFKRLKIKNKNSKAKGRGRWRR